MTGVGGRFFYYMTFYIFERLNAFFILKIRINFKVDRGTGKKKKKKKIYKQD